MECIDVFSGIGGISWALGDYVKTILYCEIEPFCQQVLSEKMKVGLIDKAPIHSNIKTLCLNKNFNAKMICGGFPCQDISCIGLQKGIVESDRSSLFFEIMRVVDECPSIEYVFLENVANITKCGMKEVIDELCKRGFNMQWMTVSAGNLGAPHMRNRWFCLASRSNGGNDLRSALISIDNNDNTEETHWEHEPCPRVTFKPDVIADDSYDELWIQRCQCLGNTVVPQVVKRAFETLARGCLYWNEIYNGLEKLMVPMDTLNYPFPDQGIIIKSKYLITPSIARDGTHNVPITMKFNDKEFTMINYPTPRRGLTHASSLTERSLRDLPSILVHCKETETYCVQKGVAITDKMHTVVLPNVNYIEWMMGYPKDWTKVSDFTKKKQQKEGPVTPEEPQENKQDVLQTKTRQQKSRFVYNGMHVFMKEHRGKDIKSIAVLWKELSKTQKQEYSEKAKALTAQLNA